MGRGDLVGHNIARVVFEDLVGIDIAWLRRDLVRHDIARLRRGDLVGHDIAQLRRDLVGHNIARLRRDLVGHDIAQVLVNTKTCGLKNENYQGMKIRIANLFY